MAGHPKPLQNMSDFAVEVSRGVAHYSAVNKFGKNPDVDTGAPEDIWDGGGLWVAPTDARLHDIVSTSINDDGAPVGTGARTLSVEGLDANWDGISETIVLDGTTNVPTTNTYRRIFRMRVLTAGSGGVNAGIITATAQTDATITAQINIGNNQTLMAIYTVPNAKTGHIKSLFAAIANGTITIIDVQMWVRDAENDGAWMLKHEFSIARNAVATFQHIFDPAKRIESKYDVRLTVITSVNNAVVDGGFDLVIAKE